ncbi:MAG: hypothetical protein MR293_04860 [Bacteroidales bacterium]|nr:hypothetical protein [Bacteroidales bacterium]
MSTLLVIITALLLDTTSTEAYLQGHYRQSTMPIEGTSSAGFSVCARSIYDIDSVNRVFGEAAYSWAQSQGNIGIENADPYLLYPYLTYDTIGGGLRTETYWFRGGYRRAKQHLIWHLALQYRALQSYRSIDPRPKNKVADLSVEGSVGYIDGRYAYSIVAQAGRYKQNNDIVFYSELGEAMVHHLVLPDQAYSRFSGAYKSAYYHGLTAGGQVMIQPQKQGFVAGAGYQFLTTTEELSSTTSIPIARLQTHTASAQFGYAAPLWRLYAQAEYTFRQGTQYLYGEAANNYYQLLASTPNYHEQQLQAALYGTYRLNLPIGYMCFDAQAAYRHKKADYPHSDTAPLASIAAYLLANQTDAQIAIRYTFLLKDQYCWFVRPIADYTAYSTHTHSWQIVLQTGVCF